MIAEGGYFYGSQDPIPLAASFVHDSPSDYIYDNTKIEDENFKAASFFIEDHPNPNNLTSEPAQASNHIEWQLGIDMDQDLHSHMIQAPQVETAGWVSEICGIQDHIIDIDHQIGEGPYNVKVEEQIHDYGQVSYPNDPYTVAADLLNLLQISRYSLTPAFPSTEHTFGDPGQNAGNHVDMNNELPGIAIHNSGMMLVDPTLPLGYNATQSHLLKDLYHSLPQSYGLFSNDDERDGAMEAIGVTGNIFQAKDCRQFGSPILGRSKKGAFGKGKANFATERERREQINVKYKALRSLLSSPNKNDRVSIVGDAIEYINELNRTLKEMKILLEKKRDVKDRRKMLKLDEAASDDGESSSMQLMNDDQDNQLNGTIQRSWVQRRSKECHVDVRIVDDEVNIKVTGKRRVNYLLYAAKVLDEFRLELIHVVGRIIGDHHIFMFNTKISGGSSVYVCEVAEKLFQVEEIQHLALGICS